MDITEISETEPKRMFIEIDNAIRPQITNFGPDSTVGVIKTYFETINYAAHRLKMNFKLEWAENLNTIAGREQFFQLIGAEVNKTKVEILIENALQNTGVWHWMPHGAIKSIRTFSTSDISLITPRTYQFKSKRQY